MALSPSLTRLRHLRTTLLLGAYCAFGCSLFDPTFSEYAQARGGAAGQAALPSAGATSGGSAGFAAGADGGAGETQTGAGAGESDSAGRVDDGTAGGGDGGTNGVSGAATGGAPGAAGNAGTAGTSNVGGSGGTGGAACITAGSELCDGFETGQIDVAKWQLPTPTSGTTVAVDSSRVHSGKYAVHIHGTAGTRNNGVLAEGVTFPAQRNAFYTRIFAYFYPDMPQGAGANYQIGFIFGTGKNDLGNVQAGLGINGGAAQFLGYSIFFGPPLYQFGPSSATRATPNNWVCLELFEDGSNANTEDRRAWVNDRELTELKTDSATVAGTTNSNHRSPAFDLVTMGMSEFFVTPTLTDMWIDDVRVSSTHIGCQY